jgi:hypothetical protein
MVGQWPRAFRLAQARCVTGAQPPHHHSASDYAQQQRTRVFLQLRPDVGARVVGHDLRMRGQRPHSPTLDSHIRPPF